MYVMLVGSEYRKGQKTWMQGQKYFIEGLYLAKILSFTTKNESFLLEGLLFRKLQKTCALMLTADF